MQTINDVLTHGQTITVLSGGAIDHPYKLANGTIVYQNPKNINALLAAKVKDAFIALEGISQTYEE